MLFLGFWMVLALFWGFWLDFCLFVGLCSVWGFGMCDWVTLGFVFCCGFCLCLEVVLGFCWVFGLGVLLCFWVVFDWWGFWYLFMVGMGLGGWVCLCVVFQVLILGFLFVCWFVCFTVAGFCILCLVELRFGWLVGLGCLGFGVCAFLCLLCFVSGWVVGICFTDCFGFGGLFGFFFGFYLLFVSGCYFPVVLGVLWVLWFCGLLGCWVGLFGLWV